MKRKLVSILLAMVLSCSLIGCGGSGNATTNNNTQNSQTENKTQESEQLQQSEEALSQEELQALLHDYQLYFDTKVEENGEKTYDGFIILKTKSVAYPIMCMRNSQTGIKGYYRWYPDDTKGGPDKVENLRFSACGKVYETTQSSPEQTITNYRELESDEEILKQIAQKLADGGVFMHYEKVLDGAGIDTEILTEAEFQEIISEYEWIDLDTIETWYTTIGLAYENLLVLE